MGKPRLRPGGQRVSAIPDEPAPGWPKLRETAPSHATTWTAPPAASSPASGADGSLKAATFTQGSILRHTLIMTATGSIGMIAIFLVDFLSLLYVSWLGRTELKAAVGFATQLLFFPVSINIGLAIAITATVSRALGAGDREEARRLAASGLLQATLVSGAVAILALAFAGPLLDTLGARGETLVVAQRFLLITLPGNVPLALGMCLSGVLRAVGDARRAMYVTLAGGLLTAVVDPLLIFGFRWGVDGAALSTLLSRFAFLAVGLRGAVFVHRLIALPRLDTALADLRLNMRIALPAILTNLATPVGNAYALHVFARFGDAAVAASAVIDRIVPLAFGVLFALTGAVGPIFGQNYGAQRFDRVRQTLIRSCMITAVYTLIVWIALALSWSAIADLFKAADDTARYIAFFCRWGISAWLFLGWLFVANAAFNNLGYPMLAMLFNWGRASLGTIPFVTLGAWLGGVEGGQLGMALGAGLFGTAAFVTAHKIVGRLASRAGHRWGIDLTSG
jgi:putative MATE family efflux protein